MRKSIGKTEVGILALAVAAILCGVPAMFAQARSSPAGKLVQFGPNLALPKMEFSRADKFAEAIEPWWKAKDASDCVLAWREQAPRVFWEMSKSVGKDGRAVISAYLSGGKIWNIEAEQVKIETENNVPVRLEIMFFNKGDTATRSGMGYNSPASSERKARFSENAWDECLQRVTAALSVLGEKRRCSVGAGKLRRRAEAWQYGKTVFVLDAEKNEFVRVVAVPLERFGELTSSVVERAKASAKLVENLKKNAFGDVWISGIPMVNQGQKGYCVPATIERVLRYYGIESLDMHKIAELSGTQIGGGTSVQEMINALAPVVKKNRLEFATQKLTFNKIRQSVDRGVPMIWTMFSTPEYMSRMRKISIARQDGADPATHAKRLSTLAPLAAEKSNAHICLIIGYNAKTKEICVSNSWGESADKLWVRFDDALLVAQDPQVYLLKK